MSASASSVGSKGGMERFLLVRVPGQHGGRSRINLAHALFNVFLSCITTFQIDARQYLEPKTTKAQTRKCNILYVGG